MTIITFPDSREKFTKREESQTYSLDDSLEELLATTPDNIHKIISQSAQDIDFAKGISEILPPIQNMVRNDLFLDRSCLRAI